MPKVYVLKCDHGRYYVGYTADLEARIDEHSDGAGSEWTREHKPLEVVEEYSVHDEQAGKELEKRVTLQHMMKYGVNNVRGAGYTQTRQYLRSGLESIVSNTASALAKDIDWVREQFTRSLELHYPEEVGGGTVSGIKRGRAESSGASSDSEDVEEEEEEEDSSEESFEDEDEDDFSAEEFGDDDAYEL
jgi:predicted GIY-YIG superfamily endonuclease